MHRENFLYDKNEGTSKIRILIKKEEDNLPVTTDYQINLNVFIAYQQTESVDLFARRPSKRYRGMFGFNDEIIFHIKPGEYGLVGRIDYWENVSFFGYGLGFETIIPGDHAIMQVEDGQTKTVIVRISTTGGLSVPASIINILFPPLSNIFLKSGIFVYPRKIEVSYESVEASTSEARSAPLSR
jgi:hypothetical protein